MKYLFFLITLGLLPSLSMGNEKSNLNNNIIEVEDSTHKLTLYLDPFFLINKSFLLGVEYSISKKFSLGPVFRNFSDDYKNDQVNQIETFGAKLHFSPVGRLNKHGPYLDIELLHIYNTKQGVDNYPENTLSNHEKEVVGIFTMGVQANYKENIFRFGLEFTLLGIEDSDIIYLGDAENLSIGTQFIYGRSF